MLNKKALKYLRQADTQLNGKNPKTALPLYRKAVALDALLHQAHYGIAACHVSLSSTVVDEAVEHITKALQIYPTAQYLDCASLVFLTKGMYEVALRYQSQALKIEPTAENMFKLSDMYKKLGLYSDALKAVLPIVGTSEEAPLQIPMHMASIYLTCGQYLNGWEGWEWRRTKKGFYRNYEECEYWDGKKEPSVIFLYGEQGFGDIIQFSRFILTFKNKYPKTKIIYESSAPLKDLFKENFLLDDIVDITEKPSGFDTHCSLLSLAHRFQIEVTSIPYSDGYLKPNEEKKAYWKQRLDGTSNNKLKVGLVWHGQAITKTGVDQRRNIPLSLFEDMILNTKEDISWYSLQKDIKPERKNMMHDHTGEFKDFSDTAAFISNLDLVITVDTAVAHLSGALGINTWLLSRMDGCWRWGNAEDNKMRTPWYTSVRVFRQHEWADWRSTLKEVHVALTSNPKRIFD